MIRLISVGYIDEAIDITFKHASVAVLMVSSIAVLAVYTVDLVQAVIMSLTLMITSLVALVRIALKSIEYGFELLSAHREALGCLLFVVYVALYLYLIMYALIVFYQVHLSIFVNVFNGWRPSMQLISQLSIPCTLLMLMPSVMPMVTALATAIYKALAPAPKQVRTNGSTNSPPPKTEETQSGKDDYRVKT